MKSLAVLHPSSELYGADRIMVAALQASPVSTKKIVYLLSHGPLVDYIYKNVENVEVIINEKMPVIYRAIFTPVGIFKYLFRLISFYRFLKQEKIKYNFDLVYVNTLSCSLILPLLSWAKLKSFIHVHEIIDSPKIIGRITAKISRKHASKVICVSHAVLKGLLRYDSKIKNKSIVLHNGISPLNSLTTEKENKLTQFYLFGRIKPEKGQWFLVDTIAKLSPTELKSAHFTLVGSPVSGHEYLLEELKNKLKSNNTLQYCSFVSFVDDINQEMSKADVCLVPSIMKDPFPTTVLEAMSVGKAVIATSHGGAKEALEETGLLIAPNDTEEFASSLRQLISSPNKVKNLGEKAKQRFYQNFTKEVFDKNWRSLLTNI
jgi:glycosyltransferase involved in cell wall biosynthesis